MGEITVSSERLTAHFDSLGHSITTSYLYIILYDSIQHNDVMCLVILLSPSLNKDNHNRYFVNIL